jgi:hypothetical protein
LLKSNFNDHFKNLKMVNLFQGISGSPAERAYVENVATIIKPGGHLLVLCGNSNDPSNAQGQRGPSAVSEEDITSAFCEDGGGVNSRNDDASPLFELVSLEQGVFDPTNHYGASPPMCWEVLLRRTLQTPRGLANLPQNELEQAGYKRDVAGYPRPPPGVSGYVQ